MKKLIFCLFLMFSVCGTAFGKGYVKPRFPKKKPVVRYVKRNIRPKRTVRQTARTTIKTPTRPTGFARRRWKRQTARTTIKTPTPRLRTIKYETIDLSHNSDLLKEWQKDFRTQLNQIPSINISLPPKAQRYIYRWNLI